MRPHWSRHAARALARLAVLGLVLALAGPIGWAEEAARQWRWTGVDRVVSVGDVHGAYLSLVELLKGVGLASEELRWSGGDAHLVITGDVVDRGSQSREALELLMRLEGEAADAGGRVHVLLGNHEVMNLIGDLRYVSHEEFAAFAAEEDPDDRKAAYRRAIRQGAALSGDLRRARAELAVRYPPGFFGHRRAFSPDGDLGRWLLDRPILVVINDVAYVHGGLPPLLLELDPEAINQIARADIVSFLAARQRMIELGVLASEQGFAEQLGVARALIEEVEGGSEQAARAARRLLEASESLPFAADGPLWYRGTALNPVEEEQPIVERVLAHLGASSVVIGHTPTHTGRIMARFDGLVVMGDTGMLASHYDGRPSAFVLRNGVQLAFYPGEGASQLVSRRWELAASEFASETEIEEFLRTAPVVSIGEVGSGRTRPKRVALADNGRRLEAIFKTVDDATARCRIAGSEVECRDSFAHEVAAYRLDRRLGLGMVPTTVLREIDGRVGSLQLWVTGAMNEANRRSEDLRPVDPPVFAHQLDRADVFDALILNSDRSDTNVLITIRDWRLHLIDHSRAFLPLADGPPHLEGAPLRVDDELRARLAALDRDAVRADLEELLTEQQIDALLGRIAGVLDGRRHRRAESAGDRVR
jgi:hypothetical protein